MRVAAGIVIIGLVLSSLTACGNNNTGESAGNAPTPAVSEQAEQTESPAASAVPEEDEPTSAPGDSAPDQDMDVSRYNVPEQGAKVNVTDNQLSWEKDGVTLNAQKSSSAVTSLQVMSAGQSYTVELPKEVASSPNELASVALSADHAYLAVEIFLQNVGSQLLVVDLATGNRVILNDEIEKGKTAETIHAYNWSPSGNQLAFSYGDTSTSKPALYQPDKEGMIKLSSVENLTNTAYMIWNKDGGDFDFISSDLSDQYKLYRYVLETNQVEELAKVSRDDLAKYKKLAPAHF